MRKMFNTLKSLVATAVMVSMLGTASLATSCVDEYDDTELRTEISGIKEDLSKLEQRVSNLESKLNSEVATLKSMIDGLNVVVDAKKVGDDWKITLADGTEFTVYGPCEFEDTDTDTDVDTYLAPKKDTDGVFYWAIINDTLGEDVTEEWLLVDGQKVPVFGNAECDCEPQEPCDCVAPELKFMVDPTTGNLLVSIDGGTTWVDSGIPADGACDCVPGEGGGDTTVVDNCIIEDVDDESKPGYVIFTLKGGDTIEVVMGQLLDFSVKGKVYVAGGTTKEVSFTAGEEIESVEVMNQPVGWSASIKNDVLYIKAPTKAMVENGAEKEGSISLHLNTASGLCKVAKLDVVFAELTMKMTGSDIEIVNTIAITTNNSWWGPQTDWQQFALGVAPLDKFEADPLAYIEGVFNYTITDGGWIIGNNLFDGYYEEGVCEVMELKTTIQEVYQYAMYEEMPEGQDFAVWVVALDTVDYQTVPQTETLLSANFYAPIIEVEEIEGSATFCDVEVKVNWKGYPKYYYTVDVASNWIVEDGSYDPVEMALQDWQMYAPMYEEMGYGEYPFAYGNTQIGNMEFEGSLAEFQTGGQYEANLLKPNTKYVIVCLPIVDGKAYADYTVEDVYMWEFQTANIAEGGTSTITITPGNITYTQLAAEISYSDDVVVAYWNYFDPETPEIVAGGQTLAEYMLEKGNITTDFPTNAMKGYGLAMGQTMTLAVMALDADGKYTLETLDMTTKEMAYSEETVAIDAIEGLNNQIAVTLSVSGGNVVKYRAYPLASYNLDYYTEDDIRNTLLTNSDEYYTYCTVHVADGKVTGKSGVWDADTNTLTINNVYNDTAYTVFVAAQFEDGSWSANMASAEATPSLSLEPFFVSSSAEAQEVKTTLGDPMVYELNVDPSMPNWLDFNVRFDKLPEGWKVYILCDEEEVINAQAGSRDNKRAAYVADNGSMLAGADESVMFFMSHDAKDLYYAVQDAEGNWYGTFVYDLAPVYAYAMGGDSGVGGMDPLSK